MKQDIVICKEIQKPLQRMCFYELVTQHTRDCLWKQSTGVAESLDCNHSEVSSQSLFKIWQEYKPQHDSRKVQYT